MATATAEKQKTEVLELQNMIGGEFVAPADGKTEDVVNPANGEVIAHSPVSTEEDVDRAVKAARKAFETWSVTTPAQRQEALLKLADGFQERADEITGQPASTWRATPPTSGGSRSAWSGRSPRGTTR
jgi:delta 1-pyrroline-5-carboxylate dehydrogenase